MNNQQNKVPISPNPQVKRALIPLIPTPKQIVPRGVTPQIPIAPQTPTKSSEESPSKKKKQEVEVKKGCSCKKTGCLKKYCECYSNDTFCSKNCKCEQCQNYSGSLEFNQIKGTPKKEERNQIPNRKPFQGLMTNDLINQYISDTKKSIEKDKQGVLKSEKKVDSKEDDLLVCHEELSAFDEEPKFNFEIPSVNRTEAIVLNELKTMLKQFITKVHSNKLILQNSQ